VHAQTEIQECIPSKIVIGRIFFKQSATHGHFPNVRARCIGLRCYLELLVLTTKLNPKLPMGVFYNRFSLDKKILKSKGSMQGSALFSRFFHFSSVVL